jgi:xanthine/uracil/vitamin C permease (AzgA family)
MAERKTRLSREIRAGIVTFLTAWWAAGGGGGRRGLRTRPAAPPAPHAPAPNTTPRALTPRPFCPPPRPASYILAVNSAILADTGGPCSDKNCTGFGADKAPGCRFLNNPGFERCVAQTRRSLVTATAATAAMSSFLMGAIANVPFAIMPGMGVNA